MNLLLFAAADKLGHFKYRSWGEGRPGLIDKEGAQRERVKSGGSHKWGVS